MPETIPKVTKLPPTCSKLHSCILEAHMMIYFNLNRFRCYTKWIANSLSGIEVEGKGASSYNTEDNHSNCHENDHDEIAKTLERKYNFQFPYYIRYSLLKNKENFNIPTEVTCFVCEKQLNLLNINRKQHTKVFYSAFPMSSDMPNNWESDTILFSGKSLSLIWIY